MSALGDTLPALALPEEQSNVQSTRDMLAQVTPWLPNGLVDRRHYHSEGNVAVVVSEWKRQGLVFSVDDGELERFPAYQFDMAGQPLPIIHDILAQLGEVGDGWKIVAWFHFPNAWLSYRDQMGVVVPVAPKDALHRVPEVIAAARKHRAAYAA